MLSLVLFVLFKLRSLGRAHDTLRRTNKGLKKKVAELTGRAEDLERRDRERLDVVDRVTHDLKNQMMPLTSFLAPALNGSLGPLSEPMRRFVELADRSKRHALHQLNNMMEYFRLQRNQCQLELKPVDLVELVDEIADELTKDAGVLDLEFETDFALDSVMVMADRSHLRHAIWNLGLNAIYFNRPGGKTIFRILEAEEPGKVRLEVVDEGQGVPSGEQDKVFKLFYRCSTTTGRKGMGMGLSIVRDLLEAHGSAVHLESREGEGCRFWFDLEAAG